MAGDEAGHRGLAVRAGRPLRRVLLDTAILVYALGADHPYREPCRRIVALLGEGALAGEASVELVQELVHVRARRLGDRARAVADGRAAAALCTLHDFEARDLTLALTLLDGSERLGMRDAVHAATALNRGLDAILSPDRDFDAVAGIERVDPANEAAVEALATGP